MGRKIEVQQTANENFDSFQAIFCAPIKVTPTARAMPAIPWILPYPIYAKDCGRAEKSQQCHKYFLHLQHICFRKTSGPNMGSQTCFLPRAPFNLVMPLFTTVAYVVGKRKWAFVACRHRSREICFGHPLKIE